MSVIRRPCSEIRPIFGHEVDHAPTPRGTIAYRHLVATPRRVGPLSVVEQTEAQTLIEVSPILGREVVAGHAPLNPLCTPTWLPYCRELPPLVICSEVMRSP